MLFENFLGIFSSQVGHSLTSYEETFTELEALARAKFPVAGKLRYRWSGQVTEPLDGLPFHGLNPGNKNIYIITGDSGTGITNGTIGALVCRDLVFGYGNPYSKIYDPSRQMTKNPFGYIKHNVEAGASLFDYVTGSDSPGDIEDMMPDQVNSFSINTLILDIHLVLSFVLGLYSSLWFK